MLHDDAARECAYRPALGLPAPQLGAFTPALYEQAKKAGWTAVSMKDDWIVSFTFSPRGAASYQLGQFGTAAKKLHGWDLKR